MKTVDFIILPGQLSREAIGETVVTVLCVCVCVFAIFPVPNFRNGSTNEVSLMAQLYRLIGCSFSEVFLRLESFQCQEIRSRVDSVPAVVIVQERILKICGVSRAEMS